MDQYVGMEVLSMPRATIKIDKIDVTWLKIPRVCDGTCENRNPKVGIVVAVASWHRQAQLCDQDRLCTSI